MPKPSDVPAPPVPTQDGRPPEPPPGLAIAAAVRAEHKPEKPFAADTARDQRSRLIARGSTCPNCNRSLFAKLISAISDFWACRFCGARWYRSAS